MRGRTLQRDVWPQRWYRAAGRVSSEGKVPSPGRVPSRSRVAGPRQDLSGGGSTAEVQKVRAKPTLAGLEPAKTRGPSGAIRCCSVSVPVAPHGAASRCPLSMKWACPAQPVCSCPVPRGSKRTAGPWCCSCH